ncbi:cupin domain-containing protein [Candidatus Woesearchaeota archaeon]|nr:cupin domain-containing protein [Candidatus Woesearchaeota archaeon]
MEYTSLVKPPHSARIKSGRVFLSEGEEVGEHVTDNKEEMIVILKGTATLVSGGSSFVLKEKEAFFIGKGTKHNVKNESEADLEYVYVVSLLD